ncbi:MAG: sigma-70 family RNA polymerase sigma factor [Bacteroidota bacterium]
MSKAIVRPDEETLVSLLQQGEAQAFNTLYDNYSPALYGILLKIVKVEEEAEDLLQEAFLKIQANIYRYDRSRGTLFTFMLNITRNLAIDRLRSAGHINRQKTDNSDSYVHIPDSQTSDLQHEYIGLAETVEKLKPEQRRLIDLAYFQGYTQTEISEEYDIPLGTVKTRMRAAIQTLRKLLTN